MTRQSKGKMAVKPSPNMQISITIRLNPRKHRKEMLDLDSLSLPRAHRTHLSRKDFIQQYGADEKGIQMIRKFTLESNLKISREDQAKRIINITGSVQNMERAFQTTFEHYQYSDIKHGTERKVISNTRTIKVPTSFSEYVESITGFSNKPLSRSTSINNKQGSNEATAEGTSKGYTGDRYAALYNFPKHLTGKGQKIALIELGGGYLPSDMNYYFTELAKLPIPKITAHNVLKASNDPGKNMLDDAEVTMDIQIAGSAAPGADIEVYFAPNSAQGLQEAIIDASHDGCQIISISWGNLESYYSMDELNAINDALHEAANMNQTILCASGDYGSTGQSMQGVTSDNDLNVQFPASSPYVIACGGTSVEVNRNSIVSEEVWNAKWEFNNMQMATGGGFSHGFGSSFPNSMPKYQKAILPGKYSAFKTRGIPDISASANMSKIGHIVYLDWGVDIGGGTSAVAPLFAALFARINEDIGEQGFVTAALYELSKAKSTYRKVLKGNNIVDDKVDKWEAGPTWDPCTGLGAPNGTKILDGLTLLNKKPIS